jgi:hypothetical protein
MPPALGVLVVYGTVLGEEGVEVENGRGEDGRRAKKAREVGHADERGRVTGLCAYTGRGRLLFARVWIVAVHPIGRSRARRAQHGFANFVFGLNERSVSPLLFWYFASHYCFCILPFSFS